MLFKNTTTEKNSRLCNSRRLKGRARRRCTNEIRADDVVCEEHSSATPRARAPLYRLDKTVILLVIPVQLKEVDSLFFVCSFIRTAPSALSHLAGNQRLLRLLPNKTLDANHACKASVLVGRLANDCKKSINSTKRVMKSSHL